MKDSKVPDVKGCRERQHFCPSREHCTERSRRVAPTLTLAACLVAEVQAEKDSAFLCLRPGSPDLEAIRVNEAVGAYLPAVKKLLRLASGLSEQLNCPELAADIEHFVVYS